MEQRVDVVDLPDEKADTKLHTYGIHQGFDLWAMPETHVNVTPENQWPPHVQPRRSWSCIRVPALGEAFFHPTQVSYVN